MPEISWPVLSLARRPLEVQALYFQPRVWGKIHVIVSPCRYFIFFKTFEKLWGGVYRHETQEITSQAFRCLKRCDGEGNVPTR